MRVPWSRTTEYLRTWLVCGEFPVPALEAEGDAAQSRRALDTDFLAEHGGEPAIAPIAGMKHARPDGTFAEWREYASAADQIDFAAVFAGRPVEHVVAYAFASIRRDEAGPAVIALGSDDGVRVWVNGQLVHDNAVRRGVSPDQDLVEVSLNAGENRLLVKVEQGTGGWGFCARLLGEGEARQVARDSLAPALGPTGDQGDRLVVLTSRSLLSFDRERPPVTVEVIRPGGSVAASRTVPRGDRVVFDVSSWPDGPYEVVCHMQAANGAEVIRYLPWFRGDALAAVQELVDTARQADTSTPSGMVHAMLAELALDRLGGVADASSAGRLPSIYGVLMEFAELRDQQAGGPGGIRPHGMVRLAYRDETDGSPQFCRAYLPAGYTPGRKWPLIVNLHGYNPANPTYVRWWEVDQRHDAGADRHGVIMIYPHGRGNTWYRGMGDRDVLRCIDLAKQTFSVDEDRVYLTGYSMGGGGVWHVGTRHPDLFAALGPYYGGWDYRVFLPAELIGKFPAWQRFLAESESSFAQAEQALNLPIWVMHGDSDTTVDRAHSRFAVLMLQRWGYDIRYQEVPGGGHGPLGTEDALYDWFLAHARDRNPKRVRIRSASLEAASAYWVTVTQRKSPLAFIAVDAEVIGPNQIRLDTDNVLELVLSPASLVSPGAPMEVTWNGGDARTIRPDGAGRVLLRAEGYAPDGLVKTPSVEGPPGAVQATPFVIVVGTISAEPMMRAMCQTRARSIAREWEEWQHWPPRLVRDDELSDADAAGYSLILIGGPGDNLVTARLMERLPFALGPDRVVVDGHEFTARDAAFQVVYPNPLNPQRYVLIQAATSPRGMYYIGQAPSQADFSVVDGCLPDPDQGRFDEQVFPVCGVFDHAWRLDPAYTRTGDPAVRAECAVRKPPTRASANVAGERLMVSELLETRAQGAFGRMMRDANWQGKPMTLGGKTYASGIAANTADGPNAVEYDLGGAGWKRLRGTIGIEVQPEDNSTQPARENTSVIFIVRGDGAELYRSQPFRYGSPPAVLDVDISGIETLRLEVARGLSPFDAVASADWADLRLER